MGELGLLRTEIEEQGLVVARDRLDVTQLAQRLHAALPASLARCPEEPEVRMPQLEVSMCVFWVLRQRSPRCPHRQQQMCRRGLVAEVQEVPVQIDSRLLELIEFLDRSVRQFLEGHAKRG